MTAHRRMLRSTLSAALLVAFAIAPEVTAEELFPSTVDFITVGNIHDLDAGDFDQDGRPDVVAIVEDKVAILLNEGDGQFAEPLTVATQISQNLIAVEDMNGDGLIDIVVAGSRHFEVLRNNGDLTFTQLASPSLPRGSIQRLKVRDIDANGVPDIVAIFRDVAIFREFVGVLLGDSEGQWTLVNQMVSFPFEGTPIIALADIDGDADVDFLRLNPGGRRVEPYANIGDGLFIEVANAVYPVGFSYDHIEATDFNADGRSDIVLTGSDRVATHRSIGSFQFVPVGEFAVQDLAFSSLADLNGDGWEDVVVTTAPALDTVVLLGDGTGTLSPMQPTGTGANLHNAIFEDFDLDGTVDIVYDASDPHMGLLRNLSGDGVIPAPSQIATTAAPWSLAAADLDNDGVPEILYANSLETDTLQVVRMLSRQPDGAYAETRTWIFQYSPTNIALNDLDGDGNIDIVLDGNVSHPQGDPLSIIRNLCDGTFELPTQLPTLHDPLGLAFGDFDSDGHQDIVTGYYHLNSVGVFLGRGDAEFALSFEVAAGCPPLSIDSGDVDHDGDLDILVGCGGQALGVRVLLNNGDGTFQSPLAFDAAGASVWWVDLADLNSDGRLDIVAPSNVERRLGVLLSEGSLAFSQTNYPFNDLPPHIPDGQDYFPSLVDVDRDGDLDLVRGHRGLEVRLNDGGALGEISFYPQGGYSHGIAFADLDGDLDQDVIRGNEGANRLLFIPNLLCPIDLDEDETVGPTDLMALLDHWGPCDPPAEPGSPCAPDLNLDGVVDSADLFLLLGNWGPCRTSF